MSELDSLLADLQDLDTSHKLPNTIKFHPHPPQQVINNHFQHPKARFAIEVTNNSNCPEEANDTSKSKERILIDKSKAKKIYSTSMPNIYEYSNFKSMKATEESKVSPDTSLDDLLNLLNSTPISSPKIVVPQFKVDSNSIFFSPTPSNIEKNPFLSQTPSSVVPVPMEANSTANKSRLKIITSTHYIK